MTLNQTEASLLSGGTLTLIAKIQPENATNKNVQWSTDSEAITVDQNGKITASENAKSGSKAQASATTEDGKFTATCEIIITERPVAVEKVAINPPSINIELGRKSTLTATITPKNATNQKVIWTSNDESVATVDDEGTVTVLSTAEIGKTAAIIATTEDGGKVSVCVVTASPVSAKGVSLNISEVSLMANEDCVLIATVEPEDATNKQIEWQSNNTNIATVDENGKVTVKPTAEIGSTATITAKTKDGNNSATCKVTVVETGVESVELNETQKDIILGETFQLEATVKPIDATDKTVVWSSGNKEVATVDQNGNVKGVGLGEAAITATTASGGKTASCEVEVEPILVTGIALNKTTAKLKIGESLTLTARVEPENATNKKVLWTSDNETVATVEDGAVTAKGSGSAVITATTEDGNSRQRSHLKWLT